MLLISFFRLPRYRRMRRGLVGVALAAVVCSGCGTFGYVFSVAGGQLDILLASRPIDDVLATDELSDQQADRLRMVLDVRQFGIDRVSLDAGGNYTQYYDTGGKPPAYNVSASRKDAFEPRTWTFPILGSLPYLGYFSLEGAQALETLLQEEGLDTLLVPVAAYSTLGFFDDPVFSSMLERDEAWLADLILHEMTHTTVFRSGDIDFNESLATFVGRAGSDIFLRERFGEDAPMVTLARERQEDSDRYNAFLRSLYGALDTFYKGGRSRDEKLAGREAVYARMVETFKAETLPEFHDPEPYERAVDMGLNNAWILANQRYNLDLDLFALVHDATGNDFRSSLAVFGEAAASADPKAYLRGWLESHPGDSP